MLNLKRTTSFQRALKHQGLTLTFVLFALISNLISTESAQAQGVPDKALPAIDFSHAGYGGGGIAIPNVPAVISVNPTGGDDTHLLQAAIDYVGGLPVQEDGFRGAVQLKEGQFHVAGQLRVNKSGIVLRGSSNKETTIQATGKSRHALLSIGQAEKPVVSEPVQVTDQVVKAGSETLTLKTVSGLSKGDKVVITRPSTKEWITALGMDTLKGVFPDLRFHWPAGSRDLVWDREIVAVNPAQKQITLDAPVTTALEARYGGGTVAKVTSNEPDSHIGVENLIIESTFDPANPKDEEHAWFGVVLDNVEDAWVRGVTARHFVSSAVQAGPRARQVTVENCRSEKPVSEIGGYRRQSFLIEGQQVLVQHCTADEGVNDFAIGFTASGPNVFLTCTATNAQGASGSYESWSSGTLYENVKIEGAALRLTYDVDRAQAGGWTAANAIIWNCKAEEIVATGPEGAPVVVVSAPESLYEKQLIAKLGKQALAAMEPVTVYPQTLASNVKEFKAQDIPAGVAASESKKEVQPLNIVNGRFVIGGKAVWGGAVNDAWWLGQTSPNNALNAGRSVSRFVPGRVGPGLTEDLQELAAQVTNQRTPFYQSGPAIWYDRRRDDHSIIRRSGGNVWAAFYELPWARSGQGSAWDGLSRYDLTKYNPWYFSRMKDFASLSDQNGIVLYHHLYNNHNLLETAAHWIDFPWRPANNINETGLIEPSLESRDRIHVANQFYDATNPKLRELHRNYIFHVLDQLASFENIIFGLSFQYSGPFKFQKFFIQTVAEWEKKKNRQVRLVLDTSKNVTDAVLADPELAKQVAVVDMRYWHYLPDGSLWAPEGGQNLAFREMHPKEFGDPTTPEQVYRQVREYKNLYPDKAIVAWHSGVGPVPALMAGGAQVLMQNPTAGHGQGRSVDRTPLDLFVQEHLANSLMYMLPKDGVLVNGQQNWVLADDAFKTVLLYSLSGPEIKFAQKLKQKNFNGTWFNPETGESRSATLPALFKKGTVIQKPDNTNWLLLLRSGSEKELSSKR
ncbi:DUF6298 domain-containing protein [Pontibacter silvestris]|uniref:DUF6298 domain-containing protein n=1 Tax=Pontibacter silvestris TaxID=2305183 RepID=A0ABW4WYR1_9BACT|nr:DUF6298 domain-containing protein [Pontibacter silvestris]MCC9135562.1 DUF6298 domain-containing protein [Pontibacter silvestris]